MAIEIFGWKWEKWAISNADPRELAALVPPDDGTPRWNYPYGEVKPGSWKDEKFIGSYGGFASVSSLNWYTRDWSLLPDIYESIERMNLTSQVIEYITKKILKDPPSTDPKKSDTWKMIKTSPIDLCEAVMMVI